MGGFIWEGVGDVSSFFFASSFHRLSINAGGRPLFLERNTAGGRCN